MHDLKLLEAVKAGDYELAKKMITMGADVNQQDEHGWTPLNFAAGKGDISMARLLVENGADIYKVGRDQRTPQMIALAAGRASVVKYLREVADSISEKRPEQSPRKYCKAYRLKDLRAYRAWSESRINWKGNNGNGNCEAGNGFTGEEVVFIHQDLTVTESAWHNENIIFNQVDSEWKDFCSDRLKFKVPDDLDLVVSNENNAHRAIV